MFYLKLLPCHNHTVSMNNHGCLTGAVKIAYKVCQFGIGTLRLQKCEKHFCKCIFVLLSLKRKINNCFSHVGDLSQIEIKFNSWLPMMSFLVYMHGRYLTFGKLFVRKQHNILILFNRFCEKPIELSELELLELLIND